VTSSLTGTPPLCHSGATAVAAAHPASKEIESMTVTSRVRRAVPALALAVVVGACTAPAPSASPSSAPGGSPTAAPTDTATGTPTLAPSASAPASPDESPSPTTAATPEVTPSPTAGATGGTVRIGMGGFPDFRNPGNGLLSESYTLYELIYDTPIALNADGSYRPELATSWTVSDDDLTWTLEIVEGATFHDGQPLTAEDIAFSMNLYQATDDYPYLPSYTDGMTKIEATSPTTLVITSREPIANFESRMAFMYVLPKHIWETVDDPVAFENEEAIGSGPFALEAWDEGESFTLAANKEHWLTPPNVDRVIFQRYGNPDARVTALRENQVDMITEFPATAVPALQNDPSIGLLIADPVTGSLTDVFFNVADPANCPEDGTCSGHPALRDVEVRRALAEAMDKQALVDVALLGLGSPGLSLVPESMGDFFASDVPDYAFDAAAANARLEAAGYADTNGDGIRECKADQQCPTGDLTFRFNYPDDSDTGAREAEQISDMWREVGVAIQIQALDPDTLTSVCCPTFDYDVMMWGWGVDPDPAFLLGVTVCDNIAEGFNETGYCNSTYDELYNQQNVQTDPAERAATIREMQRILVEDVPYIIPYYYQTTEAFRMDTFSGWPTGSPTLGLESPESLTTIRPIQ
jgi:peptide/nickel transport system substrate-binding protein